MGFLQGKRALIVGVASNRSIAYGIAKAMHEQGAELAFTYQGERLQERVGKMAEEMDSKLLFSCDLTSDDEIEKAFKDLAKTWDGLDIIVHSAAFAPREELEGDYVDCVSREGFKIAHDISSYSFAALAKAGRKMMEGRNASLLAMTYQGAERAVQNYNVMGLAKASLEANVRYMAQSMGPEGIRVNAISAGPIRTLAAAGIKDFRKMLNFNEKITPLRRNVSIQDVGNAAAFLCSDLASGITGEILHVDSGFHSVAIGAIE
jgi:enoyl-[acyl-carrier protein] reductase I